MMATQEAKEVYIETYSDKSFVVRGDTRPHRESLKAMGGKWANRLTDKDNGEKFGAWLFWSQKRAELDKWLGCGCTAVENSSQHIGSDSRLAQIKARLDRIEDLMSKIYDFIINGEVIEEDNDETPRRLLSTKIS
jgi:hypothetical protein